MELSDRHTQKPTGLITKISLVIVLLLGGVQWASAIIPDFVSAKNFDFDLWGLVSFFCLLISVPTIAIVISIVSVENRFFSWALLLPVVLNVAFIMSLPLIGLVNGHLNEWQFNRQMGVYTRIVNDVKTGKIKDDIVNSQIERLPVPIIGASAVRCSHGAVVEFHKHGRCGYLFDDCNDPSLSEVHRKPADHQEVRALHIQGPWYKFCAADSRENIE